MVMGQVPLTMVAADAATIVFLYRVSVSLLTASPQYTEGQLFTIWRSAWRRRQPSG